MSVKLTKKELFYESIAADFDNVMNRYEVAKRLDLIFNRLLKNIKGRTFLDAGCGTGLFSEAACKRGAKVTSLDVGPKLLEQVAKKCQSKRVIGTVTKMPFAAGSFDIVMATEVIEHTANPGKSLRELSRVTKSGGIMIITMPNKFWKPSVYVAHVLNIRRLHAYENWLWWWDLKRMIESNNMMIEKSLGFNIIPYFNPLLQPLITKLDPLGKQWGPLMVNMAFLARKKDVKG